MSDLVVACIVMAGLSIAGGAAGYAVGRRLPRPASLATAGALTLGIGGFLFALRDSPLMAATLPMAALPVYGDLLPVLAATLAGLLWTQAGVPAWRKGPMLTVVLAAAWYPPVSLLGHIPPPTSDRWQDGVCRQTTPSTCVPAAAATLLRHHGLDANETALASACLTTERGTHLFGLVRGLRLATHGTPLRVRVATRDLDTLRRPDTPLPAILTMKLTEETLAREPRYADDWGWQLGVMHSVVVFGLDGDRVLVGDPGAGRERWHARSLEDLWTGEMAWLEREGE